jgi:uncharacterized protein involved in outer membrane biogenesis
VRLLLVVPAVLVLVVGGLAGVWWLGGPDLHRWAAHRALELVLDRDVQVDGTLEVELSAEPLLRLTGLRIDAPPWAEAPTLLRVERAQVRIALWPLLRRVLVFPLVDLEGVTVTLETATDGRNSWQSGLALPLVDVDRLLVRDATATYVDHRDGTHTRLHLASLTQQPDGAASQMRLDAHGDLDGEPLRVEGTSGDLETALAATIPFPLDLEIQLPSIEAGLEGTIADVVRGTGLDLRVKARGHSLPAVVKAWSPAVPLDANITAHARLIGDLAVLSLAEVGVEMTGAGGDRLELSGRLGNVWEGTGLDGRVALKVDLRGPVAQALPPDWRVADRLEAAAKLAGSIAAPALDQISAEFQGPGASRMTLAGSVALATVASLRARSFDLITTLTVPDPSVFADRLGFDPSWLGGLRGVAELTLADQRIVARRVAINADRGALRLEGRGAIGSVAAYGALRIAPDISFTAEMAEIAPVLVLVAADATELGPLRATGRLVGSDESYRLDGLELDLGAADRLALSTQGTVGPLVLDNPLATALDLSARVDWPSSEALRPLVGPDLPEFGKGEAAFALGGTITSLQIEDARVETRSDAGVLVTATGGIASVHTMVPFTVGGIALELEARVPSTTVLAQYLGHELPDLGPVHGRAHLGSGERGPSLTSIRVAAGPAEAPSIELSGAIGAVVTFENVELRGDFRIPATDLLSFAGIHRNSDIGRLHGRFDLSDADGSLGVEHLEAESRETQLLSLAAEGRIDDLKNLDQARFQASLEVPSVAKLVEALDAAGGAGLGAFRFDGKLSGDGRRFEADGRAILGETHFDGTLSGDFRRARPSFKARLHSPKLRLVDLGRTPEALRASTPADQASLVAKPPLFGPEPLPLESLQKLDLDLEVQLDRLEGVALAVDRAEAHVALAEGKLEMSPLRFEVVGGDAEVIAGVDMREPTPQWRMHAATNDLQLGDAWRQLETDVPLSGELDLVLDLQASGRSPRHLASSLTGDLSFALQRGQIRSRLFALTTMSPVRWLVDRSALRGYSEIDCFAGQLRADGGITTVRTLVLDTPNVIAVGDGYLDFARETIDVRIRPSPKRRSVVELATPFAIRGNLASPSVETSAMGVAARALGRVALSPVNLLGSLLPFVSDRGLDPDNPCLALSIPEVGEP